MARTHKRLWGEIISLENLMEAACNAMRGKRSLPPAAAFFARWEDECVDLARELDSGEWRPGAYHYFAIHEPKERIVAAAPFRDRVVHHALVRVLEPIFDKRFIEDSFACRKGRGTHVGMRRALEHARRHPWVLKADIRRYFPSIDHQILLGAIRRVVADKRVLDLVRLILASHRDGVRVEWQAGDLFSREERPHGLPIGNLTSQFFANIHLDRFDHFVKHTLRVPGYCRYVDDFLLFGPDRHTVRCWGAACREYLQAMHLEIHPDKYHLHRTAIGVDFCGFVVRADGRVRLRASGVRRFKKRLRGLERDWKAGRIDAPALNSSIQAWIAHAAHAQSWHLRTAVLRGQ